MRKTECADCMTLLDSFDDIPMTLERTRAVWATQECNGAHTLDAWVANPNGSEGHNDDCPGCRFEAMAATMGAARATLDAQRCDRCDWTGSGSERHHLGDVRLCPYCAGMRQP